jgi:hypothetical protein
MLKEAHRLFETRIFITGDESQADCSLSDLLYEAGQNGINEAR